MHWAWAVAQKPFDAAARQSFTREVAASHLVSPSRLQVARQSYILEVSHIHLCDWRRSLALRAAIDRHTVIHCKVHIFYFLCLDLQIDQCCIIGWVASRF